MKKSKSKVKSNAVVEDAGVLGGKPVYLFAALVYQLVLVPQWEVGVEVAAH